MLFEKISPLIKCIGTKSLFKYCLNNIWIYLNLLNFLLEMKIPIQLLFSEGVVSLSVTNYCNICSYTTGDCFNLGLTLPKRLPSREENEVSSKNQKCNQFFWEFYFIFSIKMSCVVNIYLWFAKIPPSTPLALLTLWCTINWWLIIFLIHPHHHHHHRFHYFAAYI